MENKQVCISVVSHGQLKWAVNLLNNLEKFSARQIKNLILTLNITEKSDINFSNYSFSIKIIHNAQPKGFGENHNQAFGYCDSPYFCVLNPDISLIQNPFPILIKSLEKKYKAGVISPCIINESRHLQDAARKFLSVSELFKRTMRSQKSKKIKLYSEPDWIAGIFMLFKKEIYTEMQGFDQKYFLYCEDMDLCARLRQKGYKIYLERRAIAVHLAQRDSHKKIRYFIWHVKSLLRFLYRYYSCFKKIKN